MDHHCYYIGQCIGFGNIKQFYLFIMYTFVDKLLIGMITLSQIFNVNFKDPLAKIILLELFLPILSLIAGIGCIYLFFQSFALVMNNTTMIDFSLYQFNNPFKHEKFKENFQEIYGVESNPLWYFLPIKQSQRLTKPDSIELKGKRKEILDEIEMDQVKDTK